MTTATHTTTAHATLKRTPRTPRMRPVAFYDALQGVLTTQDGVSYRFDPRAPLGGILARWAGHGDEGEPPAAKVLYIVAGPDADDSRRRGLTEAWYKSAADWGWTVEFQHDSNAGRRTATCTRDGHTVDVRHTAAWFGEYTRDVSAMRDAMTTLLRRLQRQSQWNGQNGNGLAVLLGTPAQTGQLLMEQSLPHRREYPTLDREVREILYKNLPQARREVFTREPGTLLPGFVEYDARVAYLACMRRVPCWLQEHREGNDIEFTPFVPAFYRASWQVPHAWDKPGILPEKEGDAAWTWPREGGHWHHTWCSGQELFQARAWGWKYHIHEALIFSPGNTPGADPLDYVATTLGDMIEATTPERYGELGAKLQGGMLRAIALGLVGTFHRREQTITITYPLDTPWDVLTKPGNEFPRRTAHGWDVTQRRELTAHGLRYAHPEWSAGIWAEARYRLGDMLVGLPERPGKRGMLPARPGVPFGDLIGANTDAVYLTALHAGILDRGRIGDYRVKGMMTGASEMWPGSLADLARLARASEVSYAALMRQEDDQGA